MGPQIRQQRGRLTEMHTQSGSREKDKEWKVQLLERLDNSLTNINKTTRCRRDGRMEWENGQS